MWSFKVCTNVNPYIPDVTWSERGYNLGKIEYV